MDLSLYTTTPMTAMLNNITKNTGAHKIKSVPLHSISKTDHLIVKLSEFLLILMLQDTLSGTRGWFLPKIHSGVAILTEGRTNPI